MMRTTCPICEQPAVFRSIGDAVDMDCQCCLIKVTFAASAAAVDCENPEKTLAYVRRQMRQGVKRPMLISSDMQR
jgi:hypothetical protein